MFRDGRVGVFSICVFSEFGAQHSGCLTNVFLVTFTSLDTVSHRTLFLFLRFVLGANQQGPYGVVRLVLRAYAVRSEYPL